MQGDAGYPGDDGQNVYSLVSLLVLSAVNGFTIAFRVDQERTATRE